MSTKAVLRRSANVLDRGVPGWWTEGRVAKVLFAAAVLALLILISGWLSYVSYRNRLAFQRNAAAIETSGSLR